MHAIVGVVTGPDISQAHRPCIQIRCLACMRLVEPLLGPPLDHGMKAEVTADGQVAQCAIV